MRRTNKPKMVLSWALFALDSLLVAACFLIYGLASPVLFLFIAGFALAISDAAVFIAALIYSCSFYRLKGKVIETRLFGKEFSYEKKALKGLFLRGSGVFATLWIYTGDGTVLKLAYDETLKKELHDHNYPEIRVEE